MEENRNHRKQINIRLETELYEFLVRYSKENYKTVTAVVREMIANLYKENNTPTVVRANDQ
jgi:predicted DNA-binding protein